MYFSREQRLKNVFLETALFRKVFFEGEILKKTYFLREQFFFFEQFRKLIFLGRNFENLCFKRTINIRRLLISQ